MLPYIMESPLLNQLQIVHPFTVCNLAVKNETLVLLYADQFVAASKCRVHLHKI